MKIEATGLYTYPDVTVVCGERRFGDEKQDTLLNPDVIIEVLSDSTEKYDRGEKFCHYRQLSSLKEYVMISQNCREIEKYAKNELGQWVLTETDNKNHNITQCATFLPQRTQRRRKEHEEFLVHLVKSLCLLWFGKSCTSR